MLEVQALVMEHDSTAKSAVKVAADQWLIWHQGVVKTLKDLNDVPHATNISNPWNNLPTAVKNSESLNVNSQNWFTN